MIAEKSDSPGRRALVVRGIKWNALFQVFHIALGFAAMLVMVRIVPPAEYGRVSAVLGVLAVINALNASGFLAHALQLPDGQEPDWSQHLAAAVRLHAVLFLACHAVAAALWRFPEYRPIAPLLHLAALGFVFEPLNQLGSTMLARRMDFRRQRIVFAVCSLLNVTVTLGLALAGWGAAAIVVGGNVVAGLPFAVDLLFVQRWRPARGWFSSFRFSGYRPQLRFGLQRASAALLASARGLAAAAVLTPTLGLVAMGLLSRAQGLFNISVSKAQSVLVETVYPLLPRYAARPAEYPAKAALFLQVVLWALLPATAFLGLEGPLVSRVLYGQKWIAMDPLIVPAAVGVAAASCGTLAMTVLLAETRLRLCLILDVATAALTTPAVLVAWLGGDTLAYAWALAGAQVVAAILSLGAAAPRVGAAGLSAALGPPLVAAAAAGCATLGLERLRPLHALPATARLALTVIAYGLVFTVALRLLFARQTSRVLAYVPGGATVARWLRLEAVA